MSTGLTTWTGNLNEVVELYPFVGTEMILAWVGIASWVIWHLLQIRGENKVLEEEEKRFSNQATLHDAMKTNYSNRD